MSRTYAVSLTEPGGRSWDLSGQVLRLRWRAGLAGPFESVARAGAGTLWLRADAVPVYPPGSVVQARVTVDGVPRTLFTARLRDSVLTRTLGGTLEAALSLEDALAGLARAQVDMPLLLDARTDAVLASLLSRLPGGVVDAVQVETGTVTLPYAGDTWGAGTSALRVLREVVAAEGGRAFVDAAGALVVQARDTVTAAAVPVGTVDGAAASLGVAHGAELVNQVRVTVRPRSVGTPGSVLWTLGRAQRVEAGETLDLVARFSGALTPSGAVDVLAPVPGTDYRVNEQADGSGLDMTPFMTVSLATVAGASAVLRVHNQWTTPLYLLAGAVLRGTPLYRGDAVTVTREDGASRSRHGPHPLTLSLPLLDSAAAAGTRADWLLMTRATAETRALRLGFDAGRGLESALGYGLFDVVRVVAAADGLDAAYWIAGVSHEVSVGGASHGVTWLLSPAWMPPPPP